MEKTLTIPSPLLCADSPSILESLVSEWVAKLAINAGASLDAKTQAVYKALWIEGLGDLSPDILRAAFQKTLRECAYWPVKVADIRKHVISADTMLAGLEAENAWQKALAVSQDFGCDYSIASAKEIDDPALDAALRAAGGCRWLATCPDKELPWAKKIFLNVYAKHKALPEVAQLCSRKDSPALSEAIHALAERKSLPLPTLKSRVTAEAEGERRTAPDTSVLQTFDEVSRALHKTAPPAITESEWQARKDKQIRTLAEAFPGWREEHKRKVSRYVQLRAGGFPDERIARQLFPDCADKERLRLLEQFARNFREEIDACAGGSLTPLEQTKAKNPDEFKQQGAR